MEKIGLGIIGVGQIGKLHLENYSDIDGAKLVAVADVDEEEVKRVATEYRIPNTYTDFRKMLERDDIQAVDVCLHNNYHAPATITALKAGKHVFCEKPMAGAYVDAKAMLSTARDCGLKLGIQLLNLFSKETRIAKKLVEGERLGRLYHGRSTGWRRRGRPYVDGYGSSSFVKKEVSAGGALYDMGVYHIAQILYLLGMPPVERISGKTYQETGMDMVRRENSGYNVEELALGFVRFEGGLTLDIIESWAIHMNRFDGSFIVGSEGGVRLQPFSYHTSISDLDIDATLDIERTERRWQLLEENEDAYGSPQQHRSPFSLPESSPPSSVRSPPPPENLGVRDSCSSR